jgi:hypothetical protein
MTPLHAFIEWSKRHPYFWLWLLVVFFWIGCGVFAWVASTSLIVTKNPAELIKDGGFPMGGFPYLMATLFGVAAVISTIAVSWNYEKHTIKEREERPKKLAAMEEELGLNS